MFYERICLIRLVDCFYTFEVIMTSKFLSHLKNKSGQSFLKPKCKRCGHPIYYKEVLCLRKGYEEKKQTKKNCLNRTKSKKKL